MRFKVNAVDSHAVDSQQLMRLTHTPGKPVHVPSSNGWLEPNHSSLHTLESFSEDSLRPCKTSTPSKVVNPVVTSKVITNWIIVFNWLIE